MSLNPNRLAEIQAMRDGGIAWAEIAAELAMTVQELRPYVLQISPQDAPPAARGWDVGGAIEKYRTGVSVREICEEMGVSTAALYGELARAKVELRRPARGLPQRVIKMDRAVNMYMAGVVVSEITRLTGVAQPTLHAELRVRNVPMRRARKSHELRKTIYTCMTCHLAYAKPVDQCVKCKTPTVTGIIDMIACGICFAWCEVNEVDEHVECYHLNDSAA